MPFIITDPCIETKDTACVDVCPVDCIHPRKDEAAFRCGQVVMNLLHRGICPSDILTRAAFENAIASVATTGGSTNAVLHLLAISREMDLPLDIEDFQRISERTPLLADLKPSGKFVAADVDAAGGIPLLDGQFHAVVSRNAKRRLAAGHRAVLANHNFIRSPCGS